MNSPLAQKFRMKNLLFMIKCIFKASPILFSSLILITISLNLLGIYSVYIMRDAVNKLAELISGADLLKTVLFLFFLYVAMQLVITNILKIFEELISSFYYKHADRYFRTLLLYKLGKVKQENLYDNEFYNKYEFTYTYLYMFQQLPWHLISLVINFAFTKITYLVIIFMFNIYLGIYCLIFFVLNIILTQIMTKKRARIDKELIVPERRQNDYASLLSEKEKIKETKANRLEKFFFGKYQECYLEARNKRYKNDRSVAFTQDITSFIGFISRNFLIFLLLYFVFKGSLSVGDWTLLKTASTVLLYAGFEITKPTKYLIQFTTYSPVMIEILYPLSKKESREMKKFYYEKFKLELGDFSEIELRNIFYSYPNSEKEAVSNVNLTIKKGEIISILGYNGSGKTTLCKILAGVLKASKGEVLFNGKNINTFLPEEYYKYFGIGFQDFVKYNLTVKENIGFGRVEEINNPLMLKEAIEKTNLNNILSRLPEGIDTTLGKAYDANGQDLSGGQWQRIILARAYMGNPEILILDEPTASIDPFEEERMLEEFSKILNNKTAILISHRLSFARLADRIIIMNEGEIKESGTHQELIKKQGYYYELFQTQQNLYSEVKEND